MLSHTQLINCARRVVASGYTPTWNAVCFQLVRWRKRRWEPVNAAKEWHVREPTPIDPDEWAELKVRYNIYRTHRRAIKQHLWKGLLEQVEVDKLDKHGGEGDPEFTEALEINRKWNEAIRPEREAWIHQQDLAKEDNRLEMLIDIEQQTEAMKKMAEEQVQITKMEASTFISADDLDDAIERALNTRNNYEFAIDLQGNRYLNTTGSSENKSVQHEDTSEKAESSS